MCRRLGKRVGLLAYRRLGRLLLTLWKRRHADSPIRFPFGVRRRDSAIRQQMVATAWLSVANAGELPRAGGWLPFVACFDRR